MAVPREARIISFIISEEFIVVIDASWVMPSFHISWGSCSSLFEPGHIHRSIKQVIRAEFQTRFPTKPLKIFKPEYPVMNIPSHTRVLFELFQCSNPHSSVAYLAKRFLAWIEILANTFLEKKNKKTTKKKQKCLYSLSIWISENLWDSVKIHWISVNIAPLIFLDQFESVKVSEIQWIYTEFHLI